MFKLVAKIIYTVLLFIETLIAIRFVLVLIQATNASPFVKFIYSISDVFLKPFINIVPNRIAFGGFSFDSLALLALVFYMVAGFIAIELIRAFSD